jgi:hypothetical protein
VARTLPSIHRISCAGSVNPAADRLLRATFGCMPRNFLQSGSTSPDYVRRPRFVDPFDKSKIVGGLRVSQLPSAGGSVHRLLAYASTQQSRSSSTARSKGSGSMYQKYLLKSTDGMLGRRAHAPRILAGKDCTNMRKFLRKGNGRYDQMNCRVGVRRASWRVMPGPFHGM